MTTIIDNNPIKRGGVMEITNMYEALRNTVVDPKVGIKVVKLAGDAEISLFAAEIPPEKAVRPHYHNKGIEIYKMIEGEGQMSIGDVEGASVRWVKSARLKKGDAVTVPAGKVHTLKNDTGHAVFVLFICMPEHLAEDRFFTE